VAWLNLGHVAGLLHLLPTVVRRREPLKKLCGGHPRLLYTEGASITIFASLRGGNRQSLVAFRGGAAAAPVVQAFVFERLAKCHS